jgi:hypothetical protein
VDFDLPIASGQKRDVVAVIEARPTKRRRQIGRLRPPTLRLRLERLRSKS